MSHRYRATIEVEVEAPDTLRAARVVDNLADLLHETEGVEDAWVGDVPEEVLPAADLTAADEIELP